MFEPLGESLLPLEPGLTLGITQLPAFSLDKPTLFPGDRLDLEHFIVMDHGAHQVVVAGLCNGVWLDFEVCEHISFWQHVREWLRL